MTKAVIFQSTKRSDAFRESLERRDVAVTTLDFDDHAWTTYDFDDVDIIIYYPHFEQSSDHPLALSRVKDGLLGLHRAFPHILMYPDPRLVHYYNDKYRQFLMLNRRGIPIPQTMPLFSAACTERAVSELGLPLVVKNRFGAGGESVVLVESHEKLLQLFEVSQMTIGNFGALMYLAKRMLSQCPDTSPPGRQPA